MEQTASNSIRGFCVEVFVVVGGVVDGVVAVGVVVVVAVSIPSPITPSSIFLPIPTPHLTHSPTLTWGSPQWGGSFMGESKPHFFILGNQVGCKPIWG